MVTLLGSSGSLLPELTPLTWGWGGREGGWRRMAPAGGGGGGRGRRKEGRADEPAGWWISLWGFPALALSPAAAAAAGAGDSTFKMAPAGLASDVTWGRSHRAGLKGRGEGRAGARRGRGGGAAERASDHAPFTAARPLHPGEPGLRRALASALFGLVLCCSQSATVLHATVFKALQPMTGR